MANIVLVKPLLLYIYYVSLSSDLNYYSLHQSDNFEQIIDHFFVLLISDRAVGREDPWTPVSEHRFFPTIFQSGWRKPSHSS